MTKHHRYDRIKAHAVRMSGRNIPPFVILLLGFAAGYVGSKLRQRLRRS